MKLFDDTVLLTRVRTSRSETVSPVWQVKDQQPGDGSGQVLTTRREALALCVPAAAARCPLGEETRGWVLA